MVSVEAINRVRGVRVTLAQKAVLTWLAEHADASMSCFPSVETIAACSCAGVRTVRRALADLERDGHISVDRRHNRASIYTILTCQSGRVPERQGARAAGPDLPERQVGVPERPLDLPERQVEPSGTTKEPPIEPAAASRASWPDDDEDVEAAIDSYLKVAGGLFVNSTVRADLTAAVEGHGLAAVQKVIQQIGSENRRIVKSGWIGDRLKRGDHNQQPTKRGRRERNDPVTDQEEMLAAARAMAADGWNVVTLP